MTLEDLIRSGEAGGALVRVKDTGVLGRLVRTLAGGGAGALVRLGDEALEFHVDTSKVFPFDIGELELVAPHDRGAS